VAEEHANYWALPAMGDAAAGPTARTGSPGRDQGGVQEEAQPRPRSAQNLRPAQEIAQFFQGRTIDGKKVYGA